MTTDQWKDRGSYFKFYDHDIFFIDEGEGPAIILLHGFPTASWDWHKIFDSLKENHRVIALDFIGYGFSAKPRDFDYSISQQADLVEELLADLNINQTEILAHDYGDTVAQELLARQLERYDHSGYCVFTSCALLNGGLFPETHRPRFIQKVMISSIGGIVTPLLNRNSLKKNFNEIFGAQTQPTELEIDEFWKLIQYNDGSKVFHKLIRYMAERKENRERWVGALQKSIIPIRLINGISDPISGGHMVERYKELINEFDIVSLSEIGHYPQTEAPDLVLKHYLEFSEKQTA